MQIYGSAAMVYFPWAIIYYFLTFVVNGKKVLSGEVDSVYNYFQKIAAVKRICEKAGPTFAPFVFHLFHLSYFIVLVTLAAIQLHFQYFNRAVAGIMLLWSFYNGANFYMESFSRKYEK